jgi:hypothetical protein
MSQSDNETTKPSASKKMKQDDDASADPATSTTVYSIIHGSSNHSALDSFSFLVPTGVDADRVLAALIQSTKQHHTWTIVPGEQIDAELVQKIPTCLAHPVGTLPELFPENQTEEELLDLFLAGGAGLIAKTYIVLHLMYGQYPEDPKQLLPILVENEQQSLLVRHAAEHLSTLAKTGDQCFMIAQVSVWNQSEFNVNKVCFGLKAVVKDTLKNTRAFADEWVSRLVNLGTQEKEGRELHFYRQVDALLEECTCNFYF